MARVTGTYSIQSVGGERYRSFIPKPLPPVRDLQLTQDDFDLMEKANRAVGRLDGVTGLLPDADLFIYFYVRKEAVLSSQIEGTQSSMTELLLSEAGESGVPIQDVQEVSCYVKAMNYALETMRSGRLPLSLRLIREAHSLLLSQGRGENRNPGEFRRSQNWIGGLRPGNAVYVPPPPDQVVDLMGDLEKYLHDQPGRTPALIKAGLAHVQFETIHPFLDGNGRMGRLLITLLLCAEEALAEPLLYLSLYFKQNRQDYYQHLQSVRDSGAWEEWLRFFLEGVRQTAGQAADLAKKILQLFETDRGRIEERMGRRCGSVLRVHQFLQRRPIRSMREIGEGLKITLPTAYSAIEALTKMGIVEEITKRARRKLFSYASYVALLNEGTEIRS